MGFISRWRKRLGALTNRATVESELDEEFAFHMEMATQRFIAEGVPPDEARRRAAVEFGGATRFREEVREARFFAWLQQAGRDVRYALRGMRHRPGFVVAILLTLSLGIGASVAMFATANALFLRPLPFANAERLQMLYETNPEFGWVDADAAPANVLDWRERVAAFEDVAGYSRFGGGLTYLKDGEPRLLDVAEVTGNFFDVLGVRPELGRAFRWAETWSDGGNAVILSHAAWEAHFDADPSVIGRSVQLGSGTYEVVGVMPRGFTFPVDGTQVWKTFGWDPASRAQTFFRRAHFVRPIAKLKAGVSAEQANAQLQVEVAKLKTEYPQTNRVMGAGMMGLRPFLLRELRKPVLVLIGAVAVLLLLACANVANLAILRALGREQEVAVRSALGAGRGRLVAMLSIEHGLLAVIGGALGALTGWAALRILGLTGYGVPAATQVAIDGRVLLFVLGVTTFCALLFGAAPVLLALRQARGADLRSSERGAAGGRRSARLVTGLVALEVALAVMLVAGAGLMARTAMGLRQVDVGFRSDHVLALQVTTPTARYQDAAAVVAFQDRFVAALEGTPGIERAGIVGQLPLSGTSWSSQFKAEHWPADRASGSQIVHRRADEGYFEAVGTPLRRGRLLEPRDRADAPFAVVVNESFAKQFFADEDPIGKRIAYDREPTPQSTWYEIVGVVGDQHQVSPGVAPVPEVFESRSQDWGRTVWVVMRTSVEPMSVVPSVRATLREIDAAIPIAKLRTLDEVRRASMAREDSVLGLFTAFGGLALLLAAVGVYAVAAQSARQRTREIGIRLALGATAGDIAKLVLGRGVVSVAVGLVLGLGATLAASRALESLLYGVEATDLRTIASVAVLLLGVGVIACWIPARWATRLDPVRSLKSE